MGLAGFSAVCKQISEGSVLQFLRMRMDADERFDGGKWTSMVLSRLSMTEVTTHPYLPVPSVIAR